MVATVPDGQWQLAIDTVIYVEVCYESVDHQSKGSRLFVDGWLPESRDADLGYYYLIANVGAFERRVCG